MFRLLNLQEGILYVRHYLNASLELFCEPFYTSEVHFLELYVDFAANLR